MAVVGHFDRPAALSLVDSHRDGSVGFVLDVRPRTVDRSERNAVRVDAELVANRDRAARFGTRVLLTGFEVVVRREFARRSRCPALDELTVDGVLAS
ncbi:hypothetical protein [Natronoarchaeum mannanilyticum]|uniref:Uncharacterized protein n=1 Tax=Natronoarchaeum mannanilyticum TaxID=926360 RepID=A0AAV3TEA0_9EURY